MTTKNSETGSVQFTAVDDALVSALVPQRERADRPQGTLR
jgi:hypothetical protein